MAQSRRKPTGVAVVERAVEQKASTAAPEVALPLYGVAMLKIAMELKKPNARPLDEILPQVLSRMGLNELAFRRHLMNNGGLLRVIAARGRH